MKIIQAYEGIIPEKDLKCIENIRVNKPGNVEYEFINSIPFLNNYEDPRIASDIFRFQLLSEHDDLLWLDCDVEIGKFGWYDFIEKDKPYFASIVGHADVWAIYNNGFKDYFKKLLTLAKEGYFCWYCPYLRQNRDSYHLIPEGYFNHYCSYTRSKSKNNFKK
jgi:hypothetical protein